MTRILPVETGILTRLSWAPHQHDTHKSKTDNEARLCRQYKKSKGYEAKLAYVGHVLRENRNRLAVGIEVRLADELDEGRPYLLQSGYLVAGMHLGADKGYDAQSFAKN